MAVVKRLIDARYLISQMYLICETCQTENIFIDAIIDEIDNAPDVDAVEVVRCKDCFANGCCSVQIDLEMGDEGYCPKGRKENSWTLEKS